MDVASQPDEVVNISASDKGSGRRPAHVPARPTLEVVAARAGVSRATASRVLRGDSNVRPQAREAVLRAAGEVSYTVNRAARALVTNRTDSVAFLVAENEDRFFSDPYFVGILRGAQAETARAGLQLVFVVASTPDDLRHFETYAQGGHVDGVLLISLHGDDSLPQHLEAMRVPTVLNGRPMSGDDAIYYVDSDNVDGGRAATQVLIDRGSTRIATISGPLDMCAGLDRLTGYREALRDAGRTAPDSRIAVGDFTVNGGTRAMNLLLDTQPDIDAVFAASDLMALGAMRAVVERGRSVPQDIAVVGFDDVVGAEVASPPLTTVRQPIDELGRTMARVLFDRIAGTPTSRSTVLPVRVVHRRSA